MGIGSLGGGGGGQHYKPSVVGGIDFEIQIGRGGVRGGGCVAEEMTNLP